jgi:hypothetical protein
MKIKANDNNFEPCPEYTGRAVCVDVTPLKKQASPYGERDVFKVVFEVDVPREDGSHFCVWSRNFTPSLNEKAAFRKFLRSWLGRDLTQTELEGFDTETLIGKPAQVVVVHEHKDGNTYANIAACTPFKSGEALAPCGKYIRMKDRQGTRVPARSGYRPAEQSANPAANHASVKVHVGRCKGLELRDLSEEQVQALSDKWLPIAKANPKPTADDKRLIAALEWWVSNQLPAGF